MGPVESAINDLLRRRKAIIEALAQTELGQDLGRIDAALAALGAEVPGGGGLISPSPKRRPRSPTEGSVRDKAQRLLDEADQAWNYDSILNEWARRGDPILAADPKAALRTALWAMVNANTAIRVDGGIFKSTKFAKIATTPPPAARSEYDQYGEEPF